jgi:hypothetical protein
MGSKQELEKKLNEIQSYVQKNPEETNTHLYSFFEKATELGTQLVKSQGNTGWSQTLKDSSGNLLFSPEESKDIESYIQIPTNLEKIQLGGALLIPGGINSLLQPGAIPIDPRDISIDEAFFKLKKYLEEYDFKFKEIASQLGVLDLIQEGPDLKGVIPMPPPIPPIPWYFSRRLAVPLASTFVEIMRVWIAILPIDFTLYRFWLSLIQTFLDAIRGDLKQAIMSSLGLFSQGGLRSGILGRFLINLLSFVSPDLQEQFAVNLYKTSKSFTVGIVLWMFSVLAPDAVRLTVSKSLDLAKETVNEFNEKIKDVEQQVDTVAQKAGLEVSFPRIPEEFVPTLDDIQNIQMLARNPQVFCSPQFQAILEPLKVVPPMRFVLDMLNIPTVQEDVEATCKGVDSSSIEAAVKQWATPDVKIIPGGPANQALQAKKMLENPQAALGTLAGKAGLPMNQLGKLSNLKDMASNPSGALGALAGQAGLPMNQLGKLGELKDMASNPSGALGALAGQAGLPMNQLKQAQSLAKKSKTKKGGKRKHQRNKTYRKK